VITITDVKAAIQAFDERYPRPNFQCQEHFFVEENVRDNWQQLWSTQGTFHIHSEFPCVYFFFDPTSELQYIGKTEILGKCFGNHFSRNGLGTEAAHVALITLPSHLWFETLAIEA
jgi:hypothetical protein